MPKYQTTAEIHAEMARLRKLLRERKRQALGLPGKKRTYTKDGHEYLYGVLAHTLRRIEIFRNAGGDVAWFDPDDPSSVIELRPANCQLCAETHLIGWSEGEWDHQCKLRKKCDAVKCSAFGCTRGHIERHGRYPKWSRRAEA